MKLDRVRPAAARSRSILSIVALAWAALAAGCASPTRCVVAEAPAAVGATHVMAAELTMPEEAAPRAGASHRARLVADNVEKEATARRVSGRPGGGFSGYK